MLINTSLSVLQSTPGSHIKYWQEFTQYIIDSINSLDCVIFVAWGAHAYNRLKNIDRNQYKVTITFYVLNRPEPVTITEFLQRLR